MNISVISTAQQAQDIDFGGKVAVVIDVLRATSVITTALSNGAREVVPVKTIEEAQSLYAQLEPTMTLRGGERHAVKIESFDFGNSPLEYTKERVGGKTIILTTTNGTNAINNVKGADDVILVCFRNAEAVVDYILERLSHRDSHDVAIVCAGTEGRFSLDDGLCAGLLIDLLQQKAEVELDDLGILVHHYYHENKANLLAALSGCFHLKRLISLGFESDVRFCLETNCASAVPVFADGRLVLENK